MGNQYHDHKIKNNFFFWENFFSNYGIWSFMFFLMFSCLKFFWKLEVYKKFQHCFLLLYNCLHNLFQIPTVRATATRPSPRPSLLSDEFGRWTGRPHPPDQFGRLRWGEAQGKLRQRVQTSAETDAQDWGTCCRAA